MSGRRNHYRDTGFRRGHMSVDMGVRETVRQLREIGEHAVEAAKMALKEGVDEVVADAKRRCPVKTGKLRDSIRAEPNRDGTSYEISAEAQNNGFFYGQIVEFSPKEGYHPFLYPALEANQGRIRANIRAAINRAIQTGRA